MITQLKEMFFPREMVKYWKTQDSVEAKLTRSPEGHMVMWMKGEKYPFPGQPRGSLLFGALSPLKHWIKNKVFNDVWKMLEDMTPDADIRSYLATDAWPYVYALAKKLNYDLVSEDALIPAVKELWRAMTVVGVDQTFKEIICFILQEDDGYRNRFQWLVKFFPLWRKPTITQFDHALAMAEHAEIVGDMKERQRLFRRIFMYIIEEPIQRDKFYCFLREVDWKKVELTKADKYFFRAKWFKVDYPEFEY